MGEVRDAYKIVVGKPDGKRTLGRPSRKWEGNIRMDLWEVWWKGRGWMHLTQNGGRL